jgi:hypothetical protein
MQTGDSAEISKGSGGCHPQPLEFVFIRVIRG